MLSFLFRKAKFKSLGKTSRIHKMAKTISNGSNNDQIANLDLLGL